MRRRLRSDEERGGGGTRAEPLRSVKRLVPATVDAPTGDDGMSFCGDPPGCVPIPAFAARWRARSSLSRAARMASVRFSAATTDGFSLLVAPGVERMIGARDEIFAGDCCGADWVAVPTRPSLEAAGAVNLSAVARRRAMSIEEELETMVVLTAAIAIASRFRWSTRSGSVRVRLAPTVGLAALVTVFFCASRTRLVVLGLLTAGLSTVLVVTLPNSREVPGSPCGWVTDVRDETELVVFLVTEPSVALVPVHP